MADRLVVWLYDTPVAVLILGSEFRIQLEWRAEGIERWGLAALSSPSGCRSAPPSLLRNFGDPRDVTYLLRRTTVNMAVGNADAHAKNFSVLHEPDRENQLAGPLGRSSSRASGWVNRQRQFSDRTRRWETGSSHNWTVNSPA